MNAGTVTVTEAPTAGVGVSAITAYGYNATTSLLENRLVSSDLANRTATVQVPAGTIASETIVGFTNFKVPTGVLEICKDAPPLTSFPGSFSFNVSGATNNPYMLLAGSCSGPIVVQAGAVTVTELPRVGFQLMNVTTLPVDRLLSLNIPAGSATVNVVAGDVASQTVVRFLNGAATGQLKICKVAGAGVLQGQSFTITANGVSYTVPAGPASQGGFCVVDGMFPVGMPVTVQENPPFPYQVVGIAVDPPNRASTAPVLSGGNGQVTVTVGSGFTEVTFTNTGAGPTGQLKVCKVAGPGVAVGTNFTFTLPSATAPGSTQTITVPAGPASQGGFCIIDGAFPIGSHLTVTEVPTAGYHVTGISVNGTNATNGTPSANVTTGGGITAVAFTNGVTAPPPTSGGSTSLLNIVDYDLVDRTAAAGSQSYVTYRAVLLNTGTELASLTATLTSLDPAVQVVAGQSSLLFAPIPANSHVQSSNTFTIATKAGAPVDFSKLQWTLKPKASPPRRRAVR